MDCRFAVWRYRPMHARAVPELLHAIAPSYIETKDRRYCRRCFSLRHAVLLKHL